VNNGRIVRLGVNVAIYFDHTSFQENTIITSYPFEMISVSGVNEMTNGAFLKIGNNSNGVALGTGSNDFTTSGFDFIGVKEMKEFVTAQTLFDSGHLHALGMKVKSNYFRSGFESFDPENVTMYYDGFDSRNNSKNHYEDGLSARWKNTYPINPSNNLIIGGYQAINGVDLYPKHYTSEILLFNQPQADSVRSFLTADQMAYYSITINPDDYEFIEEPEICASENEMDMAAVINWIDSKMRFLKNDYCYRDIYGRGFGVTRSACDSGYEKIGFLCYPNCDAQHPRGLLDYCYGECPSGFTYLGPTCIKNASTLWGWNSKLADCPEGWTNMGLSCFQNVETYYAPSRLADCPGGYTNMGTYCYKWWTPDAISLDNATCPSGYFKGLLGRCYVECRTGFTNNGEFCGLGGSSTGIPGDACPPGFFKGPAERCYRNCPAGYANRGETCQSDVDWRSNTSYRRGNTVLTCPTGYEKDATGGPVGMCYTPCDSTFSGSGPLCYRDCFDGWSKCAFGCAKTDEVCRDVTINMVTSTVLLFKNAVTFGLTKPLDAFAYPATDLVKIGSVTFTGVDRSRRTKALVSVLQKINEYTKLSDKRIKQIVRVSKIKKGPAISASRKYEKKVKKAIKELVKGCRDYEFACDSEFVALTSQAINDSIYAHFDSTSASSIKQKYADKILADITGDMMSNLLPLMQEFMESIDPTGIYKVVNAFTHPLCKKYDIAFPVLSKTYK
jgi:hypothetical protein